LWFAEGKKGLRRTKRRGPHREECEQEIETKQNGDREKGKYWKMFKSHKKRAV
jgi:hypothetical protein